MSGGALAGQVAIVTGSSSGIGEATAHRLAAEGAAVVVNSSSSVGSRRARRQGAAARDLRPGQRRRRDDLQAPRRRRGRALRPARHRRQQCRHDRADPARRPRRRHRRDLPPHSRHQPARHLVSQPRRPPRAAQEPESGDRERHLARRRPSDRQLDPVRGVEGGDQSPDACCSPRWSGRSASTPSRPDWWRRRGRKTGRRSTPRSSGNARSAASATAEDMADTIFGVVISRYMTGEVVRRRRRLGLGQLADRRSAGLQARRRASARRDCSALHLRRADRAAARLETRATPEAASQSDRSGGTTPRSPTSGAGAP